MLGNNIAYSSSYNNVGNHIKIINVVAKVIYLALVLKWVIISYFILVSTWKSRAKN